MRKTMNLLCWMSEGLASRRMMELAAKYLRTPAELRHSPAANAFSIIYARKPASGDKTGPWNHPVWKALLD